MHRISRLLFQALSGRVAAQRNLWWNFSSCFQNPDLASVQFTGGDLQSKIELCQFYGDIRCGQGDFQMDRIFVTEYLFVQFIHLNTIDD